MIRQIAVAAAIVAALSAGMVLKVERHLTGPGVADGVSEVATAVGWLLARYGLPPANP
jgi:hypothetical protein